MRCIATRRTLTKAQRHGGYEKRIMVGKPPHARPPLPPLKLLGFTLVIAI